YVVIDPDATEVDPSANPRVPGRQWSAGTDATGATAGHHGSVDRSGSADASVGHDPPVPGTRAAIERMERMSMLDAATRYELDYGYGGYDGPKGQDEKQGKSKGRGRGLALRKDTADTITSQASALSRSGASDVTPGSPGHGTT